MGALSETCRRAGIIGAGGLFFAYCCGYVGLAMSGLDIDWSSFEVWKGFLCGLIFLILMSINYTACFKRLKKWYANKHVNPVKE